MHGLAKCHGNPFARRHGQHKSRDFSEQLDTIGATLNANSGLPNLTSALVRPVWLKIWIRYSTCFAEVIRTADIPHRGVERYKSRTLSHNLYCASAGISGAREIESGDFMERTRFPGHCPPESLKKSRRRI